MALLTLASDAYPAIKDLQAAFTIFAAFVGPFLLIYAAVRSANGATIGLAITLVSAMGIVIMSYADIYVRSGLVVDTSAIPQPVPITSRWDAAYFSIVTWTTLGYGDLQPRGRCRLVAASEALIGNIFLGTFIAFLFSAITRDRERV